MAHSFANASSASSRTTRSAVTPVRRARLHRLFYRGLDLSKTQQSRGLHLRGLRAVRGTNRSELSVEVDDVLLDEACLFESQRHPSLIGAHPTELPCYRRRCRS
jgi:hypothetical protein